MPGADVTFSLLAYNSSTSTKYATIRASLPPGIKVIDEGAATYRIEDGNEFLVWEGLMLKPTTAGEEKTTTIKDFVLRMPTEYGRYISIKVWVSSTYGEEYYTRYSAIGDISFQLKANVSLITTIKYSCDVMNGGIIDKNVTILTPIPVGTFLVGTPTPVASVIKYGTQEAATWTETIYAGTNREFSFSVIAEPTGQIPLANYMQLTLNPYGGSVTTENLTFVINRDRWETVESEKSELIVTTSYAAEVDYRPVLDELIRLIRYAENLHYNLSTIQIPASLNPVSASNLVETAKELSGALYWIPVHWATLSQLPDEYFIGYPEYTTTSSQPGPHALSLFDPVTGLMDKSISSFLTISANLTIDYGSPESWKDMIEFLRAQLLQRLAELGYR
jgi:hypothetical protein